jgi:hypothetical protein
MGLQKKPNSCDFREKKATVFPGHGNRFFVSVQQLPCQFIAKQRASGHNLVPENRSVSSAVFLAQMRRVLPPSPLEQASSGTQPTVPKCLGI